MAANTVLNYLPRQSVVHKMTGTTKLAFFLLFTFASMITYNTWVLLGLMAVSFARCSGSATSSCARFVSCWSLCWCSSR